MAQTIEAKTAQTVLQEPKEIKIGEKIYSVAPPSLGTLILVSEAVSHLPHIRLDEKKVMQEVLSVAKDCRDLADIAAILIIGAKHINDRIERRQTAQKKRLWGIFGKTWVKTITETRKEALRRELLEDVTPRELHNIIAQVLLQMEVGDFFGLTTFLTEINLTRQTKVETAPTASGL